MISKQANQNLASSGDIDRSYTTAVAATAVVKTLTGKDNQWWVIDGVQWSYSAAPTGGKLTIADTAGTKFEVDIIAGGPGGYPLHLPMLLSSDVTITLASGAGAVIGKLNVQAHPEAM